MEIGGWVFQNWFNLFSAFGIIASLWVAIFSLRSDTKTRQVANLLKITANHREVWNEFLNNDKLARVCDADADVAKRPVTDAEEIFINNVIQHINSVYYALSGQLVVEYEGLRRDIAQFFALPIAKSVWGKTKQFQNSDFVKFVEDALK